VPVPLGEQTLSTRSVLFMFNLYEKHQDFIYQERWFLHFPLALFHVSVYYLILISSSIVLLSVSMKWLLWKLTSCIAAARA